MLCGPARRCQVFYTKGLQEVLGQRWAPEATQRGERTSGRSSLYLIFWLSCMLETKTVLNETWVWHGMLPMWVKVPQLAALGNNPVSLISADSFELLSCQLSCSFLLFCHGCRKNQFCLSYSQSTAMALVVMEVLVAVDLTNTISA